MSEENVEIVRRGYDAYNRGDLEAFVDLFAPDATVHPLTYGTERVRHGPDEILEFLAQVREPLESNETVAEKLVEGGDSVVTAHLWRGVVKGTEDVVEARIGMTATLRGGKVTEMRFFRTFDEALEAAGLSK